MKLTVTIRDDDAALIARKHGRTLTSYARLANPVGSVVNATIASIQAAALDFDLARSSEG